MNLDRQRDGDGPESDRNQEATKSPYTYVVYFKQHNASVARICCERVATRADRIDSKVAVIDAIQRQYRSGVSGDEATSDTRRLCDKALVINVPQVRPLFDPTRRK